MDKILRTSWLSKYSRELTVQLTRFSTLSTIPRWVTVKQCLLNINQSIQTFQHPDCCWERTWEREPRWIKSLHPGLIRLVGVVDAVFFCLEQHLVLFNIPNFIGSSWRRFGPKYHWYHWNQVVKGRYWQPDSPRFVDPFSPSERRQSLDTWFFQHGLFTCGNWCTLHVQTSAI